MGLTAKDSGGGDFTPAPEGTHAATCFAVIDLGTQYSEKWNKHQHKVLLGWELDSDERRQDGKPFVVWKRFTVSLHVKAELRKSLESWRGRKFTEEELDGFDLANVLGKPCLITITHREYENNTYANVAGISGMPKGMPAPTAPESMTLFNVDEPDMEVFAAFGDKLKREIEACAEWAKADNSGGAEGVAAELEEDSIPF